MGVFYRLFTFFMAFMALCVFTMQSTAHARDIEWYRQHGVTVVNPPGAAPMSFMGFDGEPKGFIIDIWQQWSRETGIPVTFELLDWEQTLELVARGEKDIHGGIFFNEERDALLAFSQPYQPLKAALVVMKDKDTDIDNIYASYSIGVLSKGYAEYFLRKEHPEASIKTYPSTAAVAEAMFSGEVSAMAGDHPIMGYEVGKLGGANHLVVKDILYVQDLHGAVAKDNTVLLRIIDEGLTKIDKSERNTIYNRWFVIESPSSFWLTDIVLVVFILLLGIVALYFFDWRKTGFRKLR